MRIRDTLNMWIFLGVLMYVQPGVNGNKLI